MSPVGYDKDLSPAWHATCLFCKADLGRYRTEGRADKAVQIHLVMDCPEMDEDDKAAAGGPTSREEH